MCRCNFLTDGARTAENEPPKGVHIVVLYRAFIVIYQPTPLQMGIINFILFVLGAANASAFLNLNGVVIFDSKVTKLVEADCTLRVRSASLIPLLIQPNAPSRFPPPYPPCFHVART